MSIRTFCDPIIDLYTNEYLSAISFDRVSRSIQNPIVCLGGRTGLSSIVQSLQLIGETNVCAIVATTDDGFKDSSGTYLDAIGKFKSSYSSLGYGDINGVIRDLLPDDHPVKSLLAKKIGLAFPELNDLRHGFLLLEALRQNSRGALSMALVNFCASLGIEQFILPMSDKSTDLSLELSGKTVVGAYSVAFEKPKILDANKEVFLSPQVSASEIVLESIRKSRKIIISPGDILLSIGPVLLTGGISEAIREAQSNGTEVIYILNYTTRDFDTNDWKAKDFISYLRERIFTNLPLTVVVDYSRFSEEMLRQLATQGSYPVHEKSDLHNLPNLKVVEVSTMSSFGHNSQPVCDLYKMAQVIKSLV